MRSGSNTIWVAKHKANTEIVRPYASSSGRECGFGFVSAVATYSTWGQFQYVHDLAVSRQIGMFSIRQQQNVIMVAAELFGGSKPLGEFEQRVLNKAYKQLIRRTPTIQKRK